ncbi:MULTISPECIES: ABC transporter ATP-binding protein [Morganellaceae]|uniref:ABC transporter ATP-binding protein n=1 Tax=Morganellaceae TaxID=1903414 RepID=UPI0023F6B23A|nr:ABC transporter ATP-binding protein [Proteus mirabilis]MDF7217354.1 hypothetical protein [Proteus mirabilis]MDF7260019.1 hypothetical protein [Proteus mirabilis]MDF7296652.1 hypothetical protein [Proteus mirabilis]MDF7314457.1 hypothetical protein [Proteus mirabilis]HEK1721207.1 ATP-binding protein [Proteus mirabilis]
MRLASINDGWRQILNLSNYDSQLRLISIENSNQLGVSDKFCLELNSGISAICGKNGVGKSSILKLIYYHVNPTSEVKVRLSIDSLKLLIYDKNNNEKNNAIVNFIEPSVECNKIIGFLKSSNNIEDFIEGIEPHGVLGCDKNIKELGGIIGKRYNKIEFYEVEGVLEPDYTFPFIKVELPNGIEYTCLDMGAGEYLCMYIFWYVNWIDKNSILLIDEIENCISVYSQEYLMDYLAHASVKRGIWILLSSHSEAVLKKIGIKNTRLISCINQNGIDVVAPKHERKYFTALGIKPRKKGVIIAEDKFSCLFIKNILNKDHSDFLYDYHIVSFFDGESNIEKIVQNFKPHEKIEFGFLAVFDADMRKKIEKLVGKIIPVISLPSVNEFNPEDEIWRVIEDNIQSISNKLNVDPEDFYQQYDICNTIDHHDRFMNLARSLNKSEESLFECIFSFWRDANTRLMNKFILSFVNNVNKLTPEDALQLCNDLDITDENISIENFKNKEMFFDGFELCFK